MYPRSKKRQIWPLRTDVNRLALQLLKSSDSFCTILRTPGFKNRTERNGVLVLHIQENCWRQRQPCGHSEIHERHFLAILTGHSFVVPHLQPTYFSNMSFPKVSSSRSEQLKKARAALKSARESDESASFTTNPRSAPYGIDPASPLLEVKEGPRNRIKKRLFESEEHLRDYSKRPRPNSYIPLRIGNVGGIWPWNPHLDLSNPQGSFVWNCCKWGRKLL